MHVWRSIYVSGGFLFHQFSAANHFFVFRLLLFHAASIKQRVLQGLCENGPLFLFIIYTRVEPINFFRGQ